MLEFNIFKVFKEFLLWFYDKNKILVLGKKYREINLVILVV